MAVLVILCSKKIVQIPTRFIRAIAAEVAIINTRGFLGPGQKERTQFLSARKADLKKGFRHLVLVVVVLVVGTQVKKRF
jgi:hypothetical protein